MSIFSCALDGSDEVCVAGDFDHADGPDYSADGAWIWFNGEKDGRVDLWRIRSDGIRPPAIIVIGAVAGFGA